jgi:hypothetical protein
MTNDKPDRPFHSRIFSRRRRLVLLTSVAAIGAVVALGPMAYGGIQLPASTTAARAAESQQQPAGLISRRIMRTYLVLAASASLCQSRLSFGSSISGSTRPL